MKVVTLLSLAVIGFCAVMLVQLRGDDPDHVVSAVAIFDASLSTEQVKKR
jgi:hypothetical protein